MSSFLGLLLSVTVSVQLPVYLPNLECREDITLAIDSTIAGVRVLRAPRNGNNIFTIYTQATGTFGQSIDFILDDSSPGYTYAFEVYDYANNKSCWRYITLGVPLSVIYPPSYYDNIILYDLNGRKVRGYKPSGTYFTKEKETVVILR